MMSYFGFRPLLKRQRTSRRSIGGGRIVPARRIAWRAGGDFSARGGSARHFGGGLEIFKFVRHQNVRRTSAEDLVADAIRNSQSEIQELVPC